MKLEHIALAGWLALSGCTGYEAKLTSENTNKTSEIAVSIDYNKPNSIFTDEVFIENGVIDNTYAKLKNGNIVRKADKNRFYISSAPLDERYGQQVYLECDDNGRLIELRIEQGPAVFEKIGGNGQLYTGIEGVLIKKNL